MSTPTIVRVRMSSTTGLHFQIVVRSTFHNRRDMISCLRIGNGSRRDGDAQIVGFDMVELVERGLFVGQECRITSDCARQAFLHGGARGVAHVGDK